MIHSFINKIGANVEIISSSGQAKSVLTTTNTTILQSGTASKSKSSSVNSRRKIKKVGLESEDDGSYEKIITKTKILIKKGRKSSKGGGEYYDSEEETENEIEESLDESGGSLQALRIVGVHTLYLSNTINIMHRVPKPATCVTWNGRKIKTFDGLMLSRDLYCSHTLVQDNIDGSFSIILRSCPYGSKAFCPHAIDILLQTTKYSIENKGEFFFRQHNAININVYIIN